MIFMIIKYNALSASSLLSAHLQYQTFPVILNYCGRRGFAPGFVNYKKGASDKVYQLLAHGRWFSPGTLKLVAMI